MDEMARFNRSFFDATENAKPATMKPDCFAGDCTNPRQPAPFTVSGYRLLPKSIRPVDLMLKPGQSFMDNATRWERACSTMAEEQLGNTPFDPVIDQKVNEFGYPVIAHHAIVNDSHIGVPQDYRITTTNLFELLQDDVPVYAWSWRVPKGSNWKPLDGRLMAWEILTDLEGRVIAVLAGQSRDGVDPSFDPLDVVAVAEILVAIGRAAAKRMALALVRKGASAEAAEILSAESALARAKKKWGTAAITSTQLGEFEVRGVARGDLKVLSGTSKDFLPESGMPRAHFKAFQEAATETNTIAIMRNTNTASTRWIERGFPGKPFNIKIKTSKTTGIVTAKDAAEMGKARLEGFYVVDEDKIARRVTYSSGKPVTEELKLDRAEWPVEKGQVIDPQLKKPLVGDYDGMGAAPVESPGRNIYVVPPESLEKLSRANYLGPDFEKFQNAVNAKLDRPRVLHGAQDQYGGKYMTTGFEGSGGATVFFPDGSVRSLATDADVQKFYESLRRVTAKGSHR